MAIWISISVLLMLTYYTCILVASYYRDREKSAEIWCYCFYDAIMLSQMMVLIFKSSSTKTAFFLPKSIFQNLGLQVIINIVILHFLFNFH